MPGAFADFIGKYSPASGNAMHLVHCTTARQSLQVLQDRNLSPSLCKAYRADLLYMFYGRPAYKPADGLAPSGIVDLAPVCLIVDPAVLDAAVRILPFDSGGFARYTNVLGPGLNLTQFELGKDHSAPLRLVRAFYQTNANYYEQRPTLGESALAFSNITPRAYARLIADQSIREVDDRCGTIEVQFDAPISLRTALRAVVGPAAVLSDPIVEAAIRDCANAAVLPYKTYGRSEPKALSHAIYAKVEEFLIGYGSLA